MPEKTVKVKTMIVQAKHLAGKKTAMNHGTQEFDADGMAEIPAESAEGLVGIAGSGFVEVTDAMLKEQQAKKEKADALAAEKALADAKAAKETAEKAAKEAAEKAAAAEKLAKEAAEKVKKQ